MVVIPTQTVGFYNKQYLTELAKQGVVIPTQTVGFYNIDKLLGSE